MRKVALNLKTQVKYKYLKLYISAVHSVAVLELLVTLNKYPVKFAHCMFKVALFYSKLILSLLVYVVGLKVHFDIGNNISHFTSYHQNFYSEPKMKRKLKRIKDI